MANIFIKGIGLNQYGGMQVEGNETTLRGTLQTLANGSATNASTSSGTAALAINDKVYLTSLPAGMLLEDMLLIVSDAFTVGVTCDLGFEYIDGTDNATVPNDLTYFGAGIALSAVARIRQTNAKALVTLVEEAYLVMTIKGAAVAEVGRVDVIVRGERMGF